MTPDVISVKALPDYVIEAVFETGEVRRLNMTSYLSFPAFSELKERGLFMQARAEHGVVVWNDDIDLSPDTLYLRGEIVPGGLDGPSPSGKGLGTISQKVIQETVRRVVAAAQAPKRVVVFGSYGRGDADAGSDLDLLVVESAIDDHTREYVRLREAAGNIGVGIDILLLTEPEFEIRRQWWTTPAYWADREGRVVYESA